MKKSGNLSFAKECIALASTTKLKKKKKQLTDDSKFAILSESRAIELMKMKSSGDDDPLAEATKPRFTTSVRICEESIAKHLCRFYYRQRARVSAHQRQIRVWRCCCKRVNDEGCESIPHSSYFVDFKSSILRLYFTPSLYSPTSSNERQSPQTLCFRAYALPRRFATQTAPKLF